jgi:hypothetical protein
LGNMGGLSGADALCQQAANGASLTGTYKAWLSTGGVSAVSRLTHATVPYVLLDGTVVASNWSALTSGTLAHAIDRTEQNASVTGLANVWTASTPAGNFVGSAAGLGDCQGWTQGQLSTGGRATCGSTLGKDSTWSNYQNDYSCGGMSFGGPPSGYQLYCFEQ